MTTTSPFLEHLTANLADENFQICDSPSGSSTSELQDEPAIQPHNNSHSLFYKLDPFNMNDMYMQQQNKPLSPPLSLSSHNNITDPLLPNNSNPSFWPEFNTTLTDYLSGIPPQTPVTSASEPGMQIRVLGVPQTGAKSRVETQIKLCIQLVTDDGDKVQRWSHLKLPEHMVARDKLRHQLLVSPNGTNVEQNPERILFLHARVICASDPSRKVTTCLGCVQRERKRSLRRKEKVKLEDEATSEILLFNCSEMVDFSSGDTILPTRITCYCRHHNEKLGFCIYFEIHDHTGKQIATGMSPPIMITDDHKSNKLKPGRKRPRTGDDTRQSTGTITPSQYPIQPRPPSIQLPVIEHVEPVMQRLIPSEGPTHGGVEVTILGTGFRAGLTCMFGNVPASSTHFWSPNTLVCIVPPAADPGTVVVSFKEQPLPEGEVILFTYFNENDRALMELALQVVGLKMTGKVEDAREIAMRIVQGGNEHHSNGETPQQQQDLENQVIQIMQVMCAVRHVKASDVSIVNAQGHNLLHLAAMLGFEQLAQYLIDLECEVNQTDKNGFTPLHFAAWFEHEEVVSVLLDQGNADPEISNRWNKKPIHLTENAVIVDRLGYHDNLSDLSDVEVESIASDEGLRHRHRRRSTQLQTIQYLDDEQSTYPSADEIPDALPVHEVVDSDYEDNVEKEKTWMQRNFPSDNSFLQNLKNTIPDTDLKTIADRLLQLPTPGMFSNMFGTEREKREEPTEQALAWYIALAYAMGAGNSLKDQEEEENDAASTGSAQEEYTKRRDKRLFSFWVPLLCLMVVWLIFQFISSHPGVVDTIISISGFRRQYLSVH